MNIERFTIEMLENKREKKILDDNNNFHEEMMNYIYKEIQKCYLDPYVLIHSDKFIHSSYSKLRNEVDCPLADIHQKIIEQLKEDGYNVKTNFCHWEDRDRIIVTGIQLIISLVK